MAFPVRSAALASIRNRADMANNLFVDDSEIIELANGNLEMIYQRLVDAYGDNVFAADFVITGIGQNAPTPPTTWPTGSAVTGGQYVAEQTRFALPQDFGRLLRCEFTNGTIALTSTDRAAFYALNAGQPNRFWTPMHPVDLQGVVYDATPREWIDGRVGYWISAHGGPALPAEIDPAEATRNFWISFLPPPKNVVSVHILYVPAAPYWGTDDTGIIRLHDNCWHYVLESTAADLVEKQRADSSAYRAKAAQFEAAIVNGKLHPDFANPQGTVDIYGGSSLSPYGRRRNVWQ